MEDRKNAMGFGTKAIHAGVEPDPTTGAIMTPIYQTSTYVQTSPGKNKGYEYARGKNPTREALQHSLAALEMGSHALCFSSGLAAVDAVCKLLAPGDEVVATNDLYGGSYRLFKRIYEGFGIKYTFVPMGNVHAISESITSKTKLIWVETPTNPLLKIIDIAAVSKIARTNNCLLAVDNTFASPYLQNPIALGADIVMHSATKYLGGHSDVVMGALIVNDEKLAQDLAFIQNSSGAIASPMDSFLVLRGIKTLHLRLQKHCENGRAVANFLRNHPKVERVNWPGFEDHPNHDVAKRQMRDFGGMISFSLKGDKISDAIQFLEKIEVFSLAESLGGVESLAGHPATMTHGSIPREERIANGLVDSLIRLSVGVEDVTDLIADLNHALN